MKRQLIFTNDNENYYIKENDNIIFTIIMSDLKFNALDFYNGLYADKSTQIDFEYRVDEDHKQIGSYLFKWLEKIINRIAEELPENEEEKVISLPQDGKVIKLFDIAVCAGDGFYIDDAVESESITVEDSNADYAVKISGDSMEPTYKNGDILLVQKTEELNNGDIGIFYIDGNTMCKKYVERGRGVSLVPENNKYETIKVTKDKDCLTQGKVLGKYN